MHWVAETVDKLSARKKQCLELLIEDKSAKETAAINMELFALRPNFIICQQTFFLSAAK